MPILFLIIILSIFTCTTQPPGSGSGDNSELEPNPNIQKYLEVWSETLQYKFNFGKNYPVTSLRSYTGSYDIKVIGTGQCSGTQINDAFYFRPNIPDEYGSPIYINNEPALPPDNSSCPEYQGSSEYDFQSSETGRLQFHIGDVCTDDNTGDFIVPFSDDQSGSLFPDYSPTGSVLIPVDHVEQTINNCGPASLAMYFNYIGFSSYTQEYIQEQLSEFSILDENGETIIVDRFWEGSVTATDVDEPYLDGYVKEGQTLYGTFAKYLVEAAAENLDNTSNYFVRSAQYMSLNDLKFYLDHNVLILVVVYEKNDRVQYVDGAFTHFVLVTGYKDSLKEFTLTDPLIKESESYDTYQVSYDVFIEAWQGPEDGTPPDNLTRWGLMLVPYGLD